MAKPESKQALLAVIQRERSKLEGLLVTIAESEMEIPGACEQWSIKDILSHLVDWEQRCLNWYRAGLKGDVPKTPDEEFNWRQLPGLNQAIYEKYKNRSLEDTRKAFAESFGEMLSAVKAMTEEEIFSPGHYAWTKKSTLLSFIYANTANHYRWARKLIKKFNSR